MQRLGQRKCNGENYNITDGTFALGNWKMATLLNMAITYHQTTFCTIYCGYKGVFTWSTNAPMMQHVTKAKNTSNRALSRVEGEPAHWALESTGRVEQHDRSAMSLAMEQLCNCCGCQMHRVQGCCGTRRCGAAGSALCLAPVKPLRMRKAI